MNRNRMDLYRSLAEAEVAAGVEEVEVIRRKKESDLLLRQPDRS